MKGNKGHRFKCGERELFHAIELSEKEITISKRVTKAVKILREHLSGGHDLSETQCRKWIDGDWEKGAVYVRKEGKGKNFEVYAKIDSGTDLALGKLIPEVDIGLDFGSQLQSPCTIMCRRFLFLPKM